MVAVQEERWLPHAGQISVHLWRIRRHNAQCIHAVRALEAVPSTSILFRANTCARDFKETVRAVVATDLDGDTAVAAYGVTFFAEKEGV